MFGIEEDWQRFVRTWEDANARFNLTQTTRAPSPPVSRYPRDLSSLGVLIGFPQENLPPLLCVRVLLHRVGADEGDLGIDLTDRRPETGHFWLAQAHEDLYEGVFVLCLFSRRLFSTRWNPRFS